MKTHLFLFCAAISFFAFCGDGRGAEPPDVEHPVTKTLSMKAPERISAVFWTVQRSLCTIQISFPPLPDGQKQPEHAPTQVWLIKADGTAISQSAKPATFSISMANHTTDSIAYEFPASAKTEARAVVVSIGEDFFVEPLLPSSE